MEINQVEKYKSINWVFASLVSILKITCTIITTTLRFVQFKLLIRHSFLGAFCFNQIGGEHVNFSAIYRNFKIQFHMKPYFITQINQNDLK